MKEESKALPKVEHTESGEIFNEVQDLGIGEGWENAEANEAYHDALIQTYSEEYISAIKLL